MTRSGWKTVGSPGRKPPHVSEGRKAEAAQPTASKPTSKAVTTAQQRQGPGEAASRRAATAAPQKAGGRAPPPQEDRRGDRPLCREFNTPGGCSRQPCRFRHVPTPACIEALTALGCRRAGCRHRHVAACDVEGCNDAACEAAHPQDPRLMGRLPRRWEPVDGVSSTFSPPQATGSSPVAARFQAAPVAPWAFSRQLPEPPAAPTERASPPAEPAPEWRWDSPFDPGEALLLKEEELRAAIRWAALTEAAALWAAMRESEPLALTELGFAGEVCPGCGAVVATRGKPANPPANPQTRTRWPCGPPRAFDGFLVLRCGPSCPGSASCVKRPTRKKTGFSTHNANRN
ncbi:hypothetical protein DIPPA_10843 [Diplonema papillatum]|nr:hypothetical protein DIPPA_10843 [Diplonema papillatum]